MKPGARVGNKVLELSLRTHFTKGEKAQGKRDKDKEWREKRTTI